MIGNEGQYLFDCSINGIKDFIQFDDQFIFTINEYAGNILPDFEMVFVCKDDNIMPLLHEGTMFQAKIGADYNSLQDMTLYCTNWDSAKHGESHRVFTISGFAVALTYPCDYKYSTFKAKSAIESVIEVAKKNFKTVVSNITKSSDSQNWIQPFQSDREFIQKTLYRSDLADSFPMCAITLDGKFLLKDVKADLKSHEHDWKFVRNSLPKKENEFSYVGDAVVTSNLAMINKIIGYGFEVKTTNLDSEESATATVKGGAILANSGKMGGLLSAIVKKLAGLQLTENVHANYHKSYYHNLTNLLHLSKIEAHLTVEHRYFPIKPLDKVMISEADVNNSKVSSEYHSGLYYTSFISRTIQARQIMTTMKFNRESLNQVK